MKKALVITLGILVVVVGIFLAKPLILKERDRIYKNVKYMICGSQPIAEHAACQINGHTCWEVIGLLDQTETISTPAPDIPGEPWKHFSYTYKNSALQAWGITVTQYDMFRDGGSTIHVLNDNVTIYTNRNLGSPREEMGAVTLEFKDGTKFKYNVCGIPIK